LLGITRGMFPNSDVQLCTVHYADLRIMPTPNLEFAPAAVRVDLRSA